MCPVHQFPWTIQTVNEQCPTCRLVLYVDNYQIILKIYKKTENYIQDVPGGRDKTSGSVPYVKIYRYNPKHLYPKLNGYGDNGQRKVWSSGGSTHCTLSADGLSHVCRRLPCQITEIPLTLLRQYSTMADCMSCIVLETLKDNYDVIAGFFCSSI